MQTNALIWVISTQMQTHYKQKSLLKDEPPGQLTDQIKEIKSGEEYQQQNRILKETKALKNTKIYQARSKVSDLNQELLYKETHSVLDKEKLVVDEKTEEAQENVNVTSTSKDVFDASRCEIIESNQNLAISGTNHDS